ncbi:methylmalonyl-CoA epimerase [Bacillus sp. NPDC077027]|uniref:methylmalonyl-CoA epimerase n=1 Tax=Bacillus sp. NPDC077027 TaxID=3390548 RepID=UPI003CFEE261
MNEIDHIAIAVTSIQATVRQLERLLGWSFSSVQEVPNQEVKTSFARIGQVKIELLEPLSDQSKIQTFLEKRGEGLHHIALKTINLNEQLLQLGQKGVQLLQQTPEAGAEGKQIAFISPHETSGVLIELCEPVEERRNVHGRLD